MWYIQRVLGRLFAKKENLQILNDQMSFLMKQTPLGAVIINTNEEKPQIEFINTAICGLVQKWDPENLFIKRRQQLQSTA